ncbi:MAG: hypothetical protein QM831_39290 [Kofleriaceae bacterium]
MRFVITALTLCVGCDQLFQIDPDHLKHHDAPSTCQPSAPQDDFMSSMQTCSWGNLQPGSETITAGNGELEIAVTEKSFGSCTTNDNLNLTLPVNTTGFFIYVKQTLNTGKGYTTFKVIAENTGDLSMAFTAANQYLGYYDVNNLQLGRIDGTGDGQYWRFVVTDAGVVGQVSPTFSPNFDDWTTLGIAKGNLGPVRVQFGAGSTDAFSEGTAVFQHFNTCPY